MFAARSKNSSGLAGGGAADGAGSDFQCMLIRWFFLGAGANPPGARDGGPLAFAGGGGPGGPFPLPLPLPWAAVAGGGPSTPMAITGITGRGGGGPISFSAG